MRDFDPSAPAHRELARLMRAERAMARIDAGARDGLIVAYLDGEDSAVWVLDDFVQFANLPRIKPGALDQRVRYVLALLPPLAAHGLACDFVEHVLQVPDQPIDARLHTALETKRRWLAAEVDDRVLKAARRDAQASAVQRHFAAEAASQAASSSPAPTIAQRTSLKAARAIGRIPNRPERRWSEPRYPHGFDDETRWQADRIRAWLEAR